MDRKKFRINLVGDLKYEDLVADIKYEMHVIAMMTQERGFENLEIQLYPPENPDQKSWIFDFNEFYEALHKAKKALWEFRKQPEENSV